MSGTALPKLLAASLLLATISSASAQYAPIRDDRDLSGKRYRSVSEAMASARVAADKLIRTICTGCGGKGEFRRNRDLPDTALIVAVPTLPITPRSRVAALPRAPEPAVRSRVTVRLDPQAATEAAPGGETREADVTAQPTTRLVRRTVSRRVCSERPGGRMACRIVRRTRLVRVESRPPADLPPPVDELAPYRPAQPIAAPPPDLPSTVAASPASSEPAPAEPTLVEPPVAEPGNPATTRPVPVPPPAPGRITSRAPGQIRR